MDFVLTKTCEHGTTNPIVARLSVQSRQLMEPFRITRDTADAVWSIIHDKIQPELLNCYDIWIQVANDENRIITHVEKEGIKTQSNGRVATIETIPKLYDFAKAFLYAAHASLREIKSLICYLYDSDDQINKVEKGNYKDLIKWSKQKFGENDEFTRLIEDYFTCCFSEVWEKRNTIPHPGGYSGELHISNFTAVKESETKEWKGVVPVWYRNSNAPSSIIHDMIVIIDNILRFSEDILVICLQKIGSIIPVLVLEMPEKDRDRDCPIRLRATRDQRKPNIGIH